MDLAGGGGNDDFGGVAVVGVTAHTEGEEVAHDIGGEVFVDDAEFAFAPGFADFVNERGDDLDESGAGTVADERLLQKLGHGGGFEFDDGLEAAGKALGGRAVDSGMWVFGGALRKVFFVEGVELFVIEFGDLADAMAAVGEGFEEAQTFDFVVGVEAAVGVGALAANESVAAFPYPDRMRGEAGAMADDLDGVAEFFGVGWHGRFAGDWLRGDLDGLITRKDGSWVGDGNWQGRIFCD